MIEKIARKLYCLNTSNFLDTFWCKYDVQKSRLKVEAEGPEPVFAGRFDRILPVCYSIARIRTRILTAIE